MDIIKKLKELSASWESRANSQMSDSYADATHDCVDDIDDLILHAQELLDQLKKVEPTIPQTGGFIPK